MSQTHTPTPWRLGHGFITEIWSDPVEDFVAMTGLECEQQDPDNQSIIDAAHIVKCVNMHDELVEALRGVVRVADRKTDEFDKARAALTKAGAL